MIRRGLLVLGACLGLSLPAAAVITRLYPLADVIKDADTIVVGRVKQADGKTALFTREATLKGDAPASAKVLLTTGDDGKQTAVIRKRLKAGARVVCFVKGQHLLGYDQAGWFRLDCPSDRPLSFVHLEPYLRRTYSGRVDDLVKLVKGVLAGKTKAPAPNPNAKPG